MTIRDAWRDRFYSGRAEIDLAIAAKDFRRALILCVKLERDLHPLEAKMGQPYGPRPTALIADSVRSLGWS